MAILKSGIIGEISGAIGGIEVAQSKGSSVVKKRKTRHSRDSPEKYIAQQMQVDAMRHWLQLTDEQRQAWDLAASQRPNMDRFGQHRILKGRELFLSIPHDFRFGVAEEWQDDPPTNTGKIGGLSAVTYAYRTDVRLKLVNSVYPDQSVCTVWASRFCKSDQKTFRNWIKIGLGTGHTDWFFDTAVTQALLNVVFVEGEYIALKMTVWRLGWWPWHEYYGVRQVVTP